MIYQNSKQLQNSVIKNSFYLYLSHFADYILSIIFLPFIARILGASEFGKIALAQSFGIFIILILEFGSPLYLTRRLLEIRKTNLF